MFHWSISTPLVPTGFDFLLFSSILDPITALASHRPIVCKEVSLSHIEGQPGIPSALHSRPIRLDPTNHESSRRHSKNFTDNPRWSDLILNLGQIFHWYEVSSQSQTSAKHQEMACTRQFFGEKSGVPCWRHRLPDVETRGADLNESDIKGRQNEYKKISSWPCDNIHIFLSFFFTYPNFPPLVLFSLFSSFSNSSPYCSIFPIFLAFSFLFFFHFLENF